MRPAPVRPVVVFIGAFSGDLCATTHDGHTHAVAMIQSDVGRCDALCGINLDGVLYEQLELVDPVPTCGWCRLILDTHRKETTP